MNSPISLEERIDEFIRDASKIADHGREALDHLAKGDEQSACDVLNLAHYPMSHVQNDWQGLMEAFDAKGITAGGGN